VRERGREQPVQYRQLLGLGAVGPHQRGQLLVPQTAEGVGQDDACHPVGPGQGRPQAAAAPMDCPTSTERPGPPAPATASSAAMMSPGNDRASCSSLHRVQPKPRRSSVMTE